LTRVCAMELGARMHHRSFHHRASLITHTAQKNLRHATRRTSTRCIARRRSREEFYRASMMAVACVDDHARHRSLAIRIIAWTRASQTSERARKDPRRSLFRAQTSLPTTNPRLAGERVVLSRFVPRSRPSSPRIVAFAKIRCIDATPSRRERR
jgi:hypothetical protein